MILRTTRLLVPALALLGVTACSDIGDSSTSGSRTTATDHRETTDGDQIGGVVIEVRDNSFAPDHVEVAAGEAVTWDFETADRPHNVVFDDRGSAVLDEGTWRTSFDEAGTHAYECTLHSGMTGQITVTG